MQYQKKNKKKGIIRLKFRTPDNKKIIISNECSGRDAVFYRFNEKPTYWFKVVGKTTVKVTAPNASKSA